MKLLRYTIRQYIIYAIFILLVSIPVFYWVMHLVLYQAVDHALTEQKKEMLARLPKLRNATELVVWKKMNSDMEITEVGYKVTDSFYSSPWAKNGDAASTYRHMEAPFSMDGKNYKLTLHSSLESSNRLLITIILIQSGLLILLLIGLVFINRYNTARLWSPFYKTLQHLKQFDLNSERRIHFPASRIEEFNELNTTVEQLTSRNLEVYRSQKEFTENASHEMQTPLAVFQSKLELLMQTQPLTSEQAELIGELEDSSGRLARLNNALLLLTRIENNQYHTKTSINVIEVSKALAAQMKYQAEAKEIHVQEHYEGPLIIEANHSLLEILLSNLITNAIRYTVDNGNIHIGNDAEHYYVRNTAANGALDDSLIYNRFHKQGNDAQSIGLGLAIVKKICEMQSFKITYRFLNGYHEFSLTFRSSHL